VTDAVIAATDGLPASIRRSLTWDCGTEMARHTAVTATGLPLFFAHRIHSGSAAAMRT
jgi:IS30 family transposase